MAKRQIELENLTKVYAENIREFIHEYVTLSELVVENWYTIEHENIKVMAKMLGIPQGLLTAMVAVTSPLCKWQHNVQWAVDIVKHCQGDKSVRLYQGIKGNGDKAVNMYNLWLESGKFTDNDAQKWLRDKTYAFYTNLLYPDTSLLFTVDVWMLRLGNKEWQSATNSYKLRKIEVDAMRNAYLQVWAENDYASVGIMPHMLQSLLWVKIKSTKVASQWLVDFTDIVRFV